MRFFFFLLFAVVCIFPAFSYEMKSAVDAHGREYRFVPGDPFGARFYTLANGMKVYLARNTREPRIQTAIAVRAGSADDPAASTGLAHYFEHMMFKGNAKIASLDWEKERPLLEQIEELFEQYRKEKDPDKRSAIYKKIDSLSAEASRYSNDEFWTLCQSIGAAKVNAYTSLDETVYVGDIPSSNLEKFLMFNAERFSDIALRRFHTELEAVYEEFNMLQDNDTRRAWNTCLSLMFPIHPYGRSVIGLPEHLKSPSMRDIRSFFRQNYGPENMALILSGDLDYEQTMTLAEKYFGKLQRNKAGKDLPSVDRKALAAAEQPITSPRIADFAGPQPEQLIIGYRFPASAENERMLDLIDEILQNGKCGLLDKDLLLPQKVMSLAQGTSHCRDFSFSVFRGTPRHGQTLEELRDLVFAELEKLKNGDFPDWLPEAVINNARLSLITISENRGMAANVFVDSFIRNYTLADALNAIELMGTITKQQIMDFAKRNFRKDNVVIVYKRTGKATGLVHAEKPAITPVSIPEKPSAFALSFYAMKPLPDPEPVFPDFKKLIGEPVSGGAGCNYRIENTENERFSLSFVLPAGSLHDLRLPLAYGLAPYLGTEDKSPAQIQEEMYRLAGNISYHSDFFTSRITISGLQRNYDKILDVFHGGIPVLKADEKAWTDFRATILKARDNAKKDKMSIFSHASRYAMHNSLDSLSNLYLPEAELQKLTSAELVTFMQKSLRESGTDMDMVYFGPAKNVRFPTRNALSGHKTWEQVKFQSAPSEKTKIFFVDYPLVQTFVAVIRPDGIWETKPFTFENFFTEYAGRKFWSELRERRGLAYSAGAYYTNPTIMLGDWSRSCSYIQTQPDKLVTALDAMLNSLDRPQIDPELFQNTKSNMLSKIRNSRIQPEDFYTVMKDMQRRGLSEPESRTVFRELPAFTPDMLSAEWKKRIAGKPSQIVILGDKKKIDFDSLKKYGTITELTVDQIFRK